MTEIQQIIENELIRASEEFGDTFNSSHEAYAVLKEEVEETLDEYAQVAVGLDKLWGGVKSNAEESVMTGFFEQIGNAAIRLIEEAVQVAAMAKKARRVQ